ncbi:MAG: AIM24 family protein, partial [Chloroflexi bacterium]|nr:AIM24 family protein [Chloroflexota bacterium]
MAIELDTPDEHRYLHDLAKQLDLDEKTVAGLHDRCGAPPLTPAEGESTGAEGAAADWYFCVGDQRAGPMPADFAARYARATPDALCWREGFEDWRPASEVTELAEILAPAVAHSRATGVTDDIDFKIVGSEMQFVEIELDPGESVIAEAGVMMYKDSGINLTTIFGDGAGQDGGFMDKLVGAGKRVLTGESLFLTVFTHEGTGKAHVAFAAPYPGNIIPINLSDFGGSFV